MLSVSKNGIPFRDAVLVLCVFYTDSAKSLFCFH